ncbi:chitosanase [Arthroderma uncinatum]|uniref:chitosanase n=1 Tax=Arthroderma uncinatum TaxID=74035 RepID=UPI00144A5CEE|nr:chitosanase [Arthroderma uncinatum]KAF3492419.1 chitosanase [Arthroderma uncinatum]
MALRNALCLAVLGLAGLSSAAGRDVPENLKSLYNYAKNNRCDSPLSSKDFKDGHGHSGFTYCDYGGVIYLSGPSNSMGLGDIDVDCDGANRSNGDCANDLTGQSQTTFKDELAEYGLSDLDSNLHSYVVLGNEGKKPSYLPSDSGVEPLSVVAVFYGIWGDTNGNTDTGEVSISLAQACFPHNNLTGNNGHEDHDVLFVAFKGEEAKPGAKGADWKAENFDTFEESLAPIGDKLVAKIEMQKPSTGIAVPTSPASGLITIVLVTVVVIVGC